MAETVDLTACNDLSDGDYAMTGGIGADAGQFSSSRKVTFPNDERIVSGYMDPPDPWGKGYSCTTEELVCAYKAACDANCVQPHRHLLEQLQGIDLSVCNDRYEMLSCRNLRLDSRHVESLEEIFKRVQFKTLDFENSGLDEDSAIALFDMIEYYESCCKLNIAHNTRIGLRGWQMCSRMLKKTPCMHTLDLHGIPLSEQSIPAMVRSLRIGSSLVTLHLENSNITGRNLLILVTALRINESLRELLLAENKMTSSDGQHLASLLRNTPTLQLLDVRNNALQDTGCAHICEGLYEQQGGDCGLSALVLWHNQISHEAMPAVSAALAVNRHLQTLNLGHNAIGSEGVHLLRDGLLRNRTLLRLGLQCSRISCEGAVALAECLAESPQLLRLDLRDNQIRTAGLMALKLALSVNKSLTRLDLDKDIKKEPSMKDYAEQQNALLEAIRCLLLRNRSQARDNELRQLDEQQRLMEREEETSSQDSLHRPRCPLPPVPSATEDTALTAARPLDLPMLPAEPDGATGAADAGPFACVTSPTDRALEDIVVGFGVETPVLLLAPAAPVGDDRENSAEAALKNTYNHEGTPTAISVNRHSDSVELAGLLNKFSFAVSAVPSAIDASVQQPRQESAEQTPQLSSKHSNLRESSKDSEKESSEHTAEESLKEPREESSEQPREESSEQPREESSEQPREESSEQPREESSEQPREESSEQPRQESSEQPRENFSEQPRQESSEQPRENLSEQPREEPSEQPRQEPFEQPREESSEQPRQESSEQPRQEPSEQPRQEPSEQPRQEPSEQPRQESSEQPRQEPSEQPRQESSEQPREKSSELPTEESSELPAEESSELPAEESYEHRREESSE